MIAGELDETLQRPRYGRRPTSSRGNNEGWWLSSVTGTAIGRGR
jgi:hypothetical protein